MDGKMGANPIPTNTRAGATTRSGTGRIMMVRAVSTSSVLAADQVSLLSFDAKPLSSRPPVSPRKKRETHPAALAGGMALVCTK